MRAHAVMAVSVLQRAADARGWHIGVTLPWVLCRMTSSDHFPHAHPAPSQWVLRWLARVREGGCILDVAAGAGRHARLAASRGYRVIAVDRNAEALAALAAVADVACRVADLESGPWPFDDARFDAVIVTNYLWRPLLPRLVAALAPGGVLIYETFAIGNERFGRPSNPDFLLRPGELLQLAQAGELHVVAYEDVRVDAPKPAMVQRMCAERARPA
jgi:SAM-dependent methyltransferase